MQDWQSSHCVINALISKQPIGIDKIYKSTFLKWPENDPGRYPIFYGNIVTHSSQEVGHGYT
jgi:hypothetical protein